MADHQDCMTLFVKSLEITIADYIAENTGSGSQPIYDLQSQLIRNLLIDVKEKTSSIVLNKLDEKLTQLWWHNEFVAPLVAAHAADCAKRLLGEDRYFATITRSQASVFGFELVSVEGNIDSAMDKRLFCAVVATSFQSVLLNTKHLRYAHGLADGLCEGSVAKVE